MRMLRIEGPLEKVNAESGKLDLSEYSLEDLETYRDMVIKEIEKRLGRSGGNVEIDWEGFWDGGLMNKKPYLAIIKPHSDQRTGEGPRRWDYEFLKLVRTVGKDGTSFTSTYYGFLPLGTILKGRVVMGEDYFYKVVPRGLKKIGEVEVLREVVKMKEEVRGQPKSIRCSKGANMNCAECGWSSCLYGGR